MKHYNFDKITGEFLSEEPTAVNPREDGKFLIPSSATTVAPPPVDANQIAIFNGNEWSVVKDFRNQEFYNSNGDEIVISALDVEPDEEWATTPPPPSLNNVKTLKKLELKQFYNQKIEEGFIFEGNTYQIRDGDRIVMAVVMLNFSRGKLDAHHGFWRSLDNQMITMSDAKVQEFLDAVEVYGAALYQPSWQHADAIELLSNVDDINDYDFTTNWPINA